MGIEVLAIPRAEQTLIVLLVKERPPLKETPVNTLTVVLHGLESPESPPPIILVMFSTSWKRLLMEKFWLMLLLMVLWYVNELS